MPSSTIGYRITRRTVQTFLRGVGATRWRVAYGQFSAEGRLSRADGKRHQDMTADQVVALLPFLRAKNAEGMSVYAGPMLHEVFYVDDVDAAGAHRFEQMGLPVQAVVETSPGSHQVWFPVPPGVTAWSLSASLCRLVGGDEKAHESGSGLQPRIGRLPGLTNTKPRRRMANGLFPYVRLSRVNNGPPPDDKIALLAKLALGVTGLDLSLVSDDVSNAGGTHAAGRAGAAARGKADLRSAKPTESEMLASGRSEADWREIRSMLRAGASFEQCVTHLQIARSEKPADYAIRTVARAATSLGMQRLVPNDPVIQRFCNMYLQDRRRS